MVSVPDPVADDTIKAVVELGKSLKVVDVNPEWEALSSVPWETDRSPGTVPPCRSTAGHGPATGAGGHSSRLWAAGKQLSQTENQELADEH